VVLNGITRFLDLGLSVHGAEVDEMTFVTPRERRQTWTPEEDQRLLALKAAGTPLAVIAKTLGRTRASVDARTAKLKNQAKGK
jgi:hypothetical protein